MGWAARLNPRAQLKWSGELKPIAKVARPHFKRRDFEHMWAAFLARVTAPKSTKDAA